MPPTSPPALETAPALTLVWRDLAPRLMELCRVEPRLLDRVTRAPRPAFHAYCAYFAANAATACDALARRAYEGEPKHLLADALGDGLAGAGALGGAAAIAPVWRVLKNLEADHALPLASYRRLATLAANPRIAPLMRAQPLGASTLDALETLSRDIAQDDLLAAAAAGIVPTTPRSVSRARKALILLRAFGVVDDGMRARLARCRSMSQLQRLFSTTFQNAPLPDLGIDFGRHLRRLRTVAELRRAGHRYSNCLAGLTPHVVDDYLAGKSCLLEFTRDGEPCALVTLGIVTPFLRPILVKIDTILGPKNTRPDPAIAREVTGLLEATPGLLLMDSNLAYSLMPILETQTCDADIADEDFDEMFLEQDDADLIPL
jgi:hypothetical protein